MQNINTEYDAVISYRHSTGFYMAQILYSNMISNGYTVFMDKTMASGDFTEKIHDAIKNCKNFIVVLFPDDIPELKSESSWLNTEATWAIETPNINIVPVMCDDFEWPKNLSELTQTMQIVQKNNGVKIHKDYSLDNDLNNLCEIFLKNVTSSKPKITAVDFFKLYLEERHDVTVKSVEMAFHAGAPWLMPGEKNRLFINSLKNKTPWRILINTVEASESIGQHMRDDNAFYIPFEQVHAQWKRLRELYPDVLEVRECDIPLIHIHHSVHLVSNVTNKESGELHVQYYAYDNTSPDKAFEHKINSCSKFYSIYMDEFEYLWNRSKDI